jgi:tetratricopeptide (TPR) repeat protein
MHKAHLYIFLILISFLMGCASLDTSKKTKLASQHLNPNPAPNSMSPPDLDGEPVLDETHVRTQADYHFALGEAYSLDGESVRAIEEFKLVTIYDANSVTVRLRLAGEYLKQGLLTEAVEQAEIALKLDAVNIETRLFLGGLYSALKMYRQAQEQYLSVLKVEPNHTDVPFYLGALYAEQGQYIDAIKHFELIAETKSHHKRHLAYYYIGKIHSTQWAESSDNKTSPNPNSKEFFAAEKSYSQCLQVLPSFEEGALALFDLYNAAKTPVKGLRVLESYQRQFGPKKSVAYQLSQYYLDKEDYEKAYKHLSDLESFEPTNMNVKMKMALILIEQKKYDESIVKLEEILTVTPNSDKIRFYLAAVYEEIGRLDLAITNFTKIEPTSTYFTDATVHAAYLHRKNKNVDAALEIMDKAIRVRDDVPQFYSFYASVLDEKKEYKRGVTLLEKALQKFSDNTQLRFYLGSMYDRVGQPEKTIVEMRRVLAIDGEHVQALNYLAFTYAELNQNLDEAEQLANKALQLQPGDPYILDTVGWVMFKQGRAEESIQYLEAAHKIKPDESIVAEHLGDAYYVFEMIERAKGMYQKAVATENDENKRAKIQSKLNALLLQKGDKRSPASQK